MVPPRPSFNVFVLAALLGPLVSVPGAAALAPQEPHGGGVSTSPGDSTDLRSGAEDAQEVFERDRIRNSPRTWGSSGASCDETVGRMCLRFDPDGPVHPDWRPPEEDPRIQDARRTLLATLERIAERIPGDAWVLGQRVMYHGEAGEWEIASGLARQCGLPRSRDWWCRALEGTAFHRLGHYLRASAAFADALETMPDELRREWTDLEPLLDREARGRFDDLPPDSVAAFRERFWTLADPLLGVPGRERETEHYARLVLAHSREEAANPYRMSWSRDLREILVRYGAAIHYEVARGDPLRPGPVAAIGHHDPRAWHSLPDAAQLFAPAAIEAGSWRTDRRAASAYQVSADAPTVQPIDLQQARFRRGDDLFLVLGWTLEDRWSEAGRYPPESRSVRDPDRAEIGGAEARSRGEFEPWLFLLGHDRVNRNEGVFPSVGEFLLRPTLAGDPSIARGAVHARAALGEYLLSLEFLDRAGGRAWRERHGVSLAPLPRGVVALSDLLLLEPDAEVESDRTSRGESLESHLHRVVPGRRIESGPVEVAWEVYGLSPSENRLRFRVTAAPAERGVLRRAAEFLRLVGPPDRSEVSWSEGVAPDGEVGQEGAIFRRVLMDLSAISPGPVRLRLSLEPVGRTEVTAEVLVELLEGSAAAP